MSAWTTIILRLARNPDAGYPAGDEERGYHIVAPLKPGGLIDLATWRRTRRDARSIASRPMMPRRRTDGSAIAAHIGIFAMTRVRKVLTSPCFG